MSFGETDFEKILPSYLTGEGKERLKAALKQFTDSGDNNINYSGFFIGNESNIQDFLQSDLVKEIRYPDWDFESKTYIKGYTNAIILSNSCDISQSNQREGNIKECLFAPMLEFNIYLDGLSSGYSADQILSLKNAIKSQLKTNLFYIPEIFEGGKDYVILLDKVFQFPVSELQSYLPDINNNRIASFSRFGYYLFILKLSYHLCRLPEEEDIERGF